MRNYRLAVSTTKQNTNRFGSQTNAFAAIQTTVNRIILIYRRDLASTFTLVSGTNTVFTDANDGGFTNNSSQDTDRNQVVLDMTIGNANYDIGHVFSFTPNRTDLLPVRICVTTQPKLKVSQGRQIRRLPDLTLITSRTSLDINLVYESYFQQRFRRFLLNPLDGFSV